MAESQDIEDIIRILVASDNHLGYHEKDTITGEDSFTTFEEILQLAITEDVDLILLGGDLFHDAVPSQNTLHKCMQLLRSYTFGDKHVSLEILSQQNHNFHNAVNETVNYEDPNLNISIPVFSIHGNHDDPSCFGRLSSLDILSTSGLLNYFGRCTDLTKIDIDPVLIQKGKTKLALYGLSHIHDARLARLFEDSKIGIERPGGEENEWFHLMVLHQNRADRGLKNFLPEKLLPEFLHLIIWGHEHDCRITPEQNIIKRFFVSQPGSSVPTSLAEGEAIKKHVAILQIYKDKFLLNPTPLQTTRPFIFRSINLSEMLKEIDIFVGDPAEKVKTFAIHKVEEMIEEAKTLQTGHPKQPILPLIRLRIIFEDEKCMFNTIRFGQKFADRVANPNDIVLLKKNAPKIKRAESGLDSVALKSAFDKMQIDTNTRVEHLVERYFKEISGKKTLELTPIEVFSELCYRLVDKQDINTAENILRCYEENCVEHLIEKFPNPNEIRDHIDKIKNEITLDYILQKINSTKSEKPILSKSVSSKEHIETLKPMKGNTRGRGRGGSRALMKNVSPQKQSRPNSKNKSRNSASVLESHKNSNVYEITDESD